MKDCKTDTIVDETRGVQAVCLTCEGPLGVMHGKPDGMTNMEALAKCYEERDQHVAGTRAVVR